MIPIYFYGIFLADPILPDGAISGNWLVLILAGITAFFFIRTLNKLESSMKSLTTQITIIREEQISLRKDVDNMPTIDAADVAEQILTKLFAMNPPSGRQWPFPRRTERDEDPGR